MKIVAFILCAVVEDENILRAGRANAWGCEKRKKELRNKS